MSTAVYAYYMYVMYIVQDCITICIHEQILAHIYNDNDEYFWIFFKTFLIMNELKDGCSNQNDLYECMN